MQTLIDKIREFTADIPGVIFYFRDGENRYRFVNEAYEQLSGFTVEELKGKTDVEVYGEEIASGWAPADNAVLKYNSVVIAYETFYDFKYEKWRRYVTTKLPMWGATGERFLVGVSVEVHSDWETLLAVRQARLDVSKLSALSDPNHTPPYIGFYPIELPPVGVFASIDRLNAEGHRPESPIFNLPSKGDD